MSETIKITVDGQEHELPARMLNLVFHKDMMNIEAPECFEINPENTLAEVRSLDNKKWQYITTGQIFQYLFRKVFPLEDSKENIHSVKTVKIPETIEELLKSDLGVQHVSGLIILAMTQCGILGKKPFFKLPETYLHPAYQGGLADLFLALPQVLDYLQNTSDKATVTGEPPKTPMEAWLG